MQGPGTSSVGMNTGFIVCSENATGGGGGGGGGGGQNRTMAIE